MIAVSRRARLHEDRAGDPLDGLVNLFDLGIVLAVAFLLASLASLHVAIDESGLTQPKNSVTVKPGDTTGKVPTDGASVIGTGTEVGKVYRLSDGQLVYVVPSASPPPIPGRSMTFLWQGLQEAWHLLITGDPYLMSLLRITLQVAGVAMGVAVVLGLPIGLGLGLGRFPGRRVLIALANAGMGLPPVLVGLVLALLMFPGSPISQFRLLFTLKAIFIAQAILALPLMIALTCSAVEALPDGLLDQARAFQARRWRIALLATREAWTGIMAGAIAAAGTAFSEVGAVVLVGGNIQGYDQTLASAALFQVNAGHWADGAAIGVLLLGLVIIVAALLTALQHGGALARRWRP